MFLVRDTIQARHAKIRSFLQSDPVIAVLLAAADFEWTIRRAIISLATQSNAEVTRLLKQCYGLERYKNLWKKLVKPHWEKGLAGIVPEWQRFFETSFPLRDRIIHGIKVNPGQKFAATQTERILAASAAVADFAARAGRPVYGKRLPRK